MEEISEIAFPILPSLKKLLESNAEKLKTITNSNINETKTALYSYASLAEFFENLPNLLKNKEDLYVAYSNTLGNSLINENINFDIVSEIQKIDEIKLNKISNMFPQFPLILKESEINEAINFLLEKEIILEQTADLMLKAIQSLEAVLNSLDIAPGLPNNQEFIRTKIGLKNLYATIQKVAATGKSGIFGKNEQEILLQVATVLEMFQTLANQWDNISGILKNKIQEIERSGLAKDQSFDLTGLNLPDAENEKLKDSINLLQNMIVRRISVAGSGGWFSNLKRRFKGKPIYPANLDPKSIALDIIDLIKKVAIKQELGASQEPATQNKQAETSPASVSIVELTNRNHFVNEALSDVKKILDNLSQTLQTIKTASKNAVTNLGKAPEANLGASQSPAVSNANDQTQFSQDMDKPISTQQPAPTSKPQQNEPVVTQPVKDEDITAFFGTKGLEYLKKILPTVKPEQKQKLVNFIQNFSTKS
jgi:hypothetical protein